MCRARLAGRCSAPLLLLSLALLAGQLPACHGKVTYARLFRDDRALIPVAPDFAFADRGRIDIKLREISIWQQHNEERDVDYNNFGFILAPVMQEDDSLQQDLLNGKCVLTDREPKLLTFAKPQVMKVIQGKAENATFHVDIENGGWYYLYFVNCQPGAAVSFRVRVSMYNLNPDNSRDYLSVGETELDAVYWIMFSLFAVITVAWFVLLRMKRESVHRIHWFMGALAVCKTLTLMAQALMTMHVERTGEPEGWNVAYYVFTTARGLLFFTVVVLIGAGWSYMKPFMDDNTRKTLLVVVPLQVFANIALVFIDEESPAMRDWLTWRDIFHLVDIACCCAILFPIVWQIKHLREAAEVDGKAARSLAKLKLFRSFYITVVVYIYFTRIIVYLLHSTVDYRYVWTTDAAAELAALAFYLWVGVSFRPAKENQYFKLDQEDIELATAY